MQYATDVLQIVAIHFFFHLTAYFLMWLGEVDAEDGDEGGDLFREPADLVGLGRVILICNYKKMLSDDQWNLKSFRNGEGGGEKEGENLW